MKIKKIALVSIFIAVMAVIFLLREEPSAPVVENKNPSNIDKNIFKNGNDIFITPQELKQKIDSEGRSSLVILDASHPKGYAKGHIPGAISIGFKGLSRTEGKPGDKEWGTLLPKDELVTKLESLGINNSKLVVAYSDILKGPGAGGRAVWQMKMAGFENVRLLYGGLEAWKNLGYELSQKSVKAQVVSGLVLKDFDESFRSKQGYIFENLSTLKIVDVRSLKEYTGEDTSRGEARGGHIKNAKWLEWKTLLNQDATVKSPDEIIALMASIDIKPDDDFVLY